MSENNPYASLSRAELKALEKLHKNNPPTLLLVQDALKDSTPYRAGRLRNTEMSDVAKALKLAIAANPNPEVVSKAEQALAIVDKFFGPEPVKNPGDGESSSTGTQTPSATLAA